MMSTLRSTVTLLASIVILILAPQASAVTVNLLNADGIWITTTPSSPEVSGGGTNAISWGDPATWRGPSGYVYTETAPPPTDQPLGSKFKIGTFTHINNPIRGDFLETATLQIDYEVELFDGGSLGTYSGSSFFDFEHFETPNLQDPCANGGDLGSGVNRRGCADRVTFSMNDALSESFMASNGVTYQFMLSGFLLGNGTLAEEFWTKEKRHNTAYLMASVTAIPIPAAGLLFASILGLFGVLRLRRNEAALAPA